MKKTTKSKEVSSKNIAKVPQEFYGWLTVLLFFKGSLLSEKEESGEPNRTFFFKSALVI